MYTVQKLQLGDEIRIIAPSRSMSLLSEEGIAKAKETLQSLGYVVTFGKHVFECDIQQSSSIASRLEDLHNAFADQHVKAILTAIGGFNCNELLPYIDYERTRKFYVAIATLRLLRMRLRHIVISLRTVVHTFLAFKWKSFKRIKAIFSAHVSQMISRFY